MTEMTGWPALEQGALIQAVLTNGLQLEGAVDSYEGAWLHLRTNSGLLAISRDHVVLVVLEGSLPKTSGRKRRQSASLDVPTLTARDADTDIPDDETLRNVSMAILDGVEGPELRAIGGLSASRLARVRQAFECARGNLQIEDLPPAARELVDPIRKSLGG